MLGQGLIDCFAQGLAGLEMRHTLGGYLYGLAAARIAANAGWAMIDGKTAKAANFDAMATYQRIGDSVQNRFDSLFSITLVQLAKSGGQFFH